MKEKLMKNMGYLITLLDIGVYFILSYMYVDVLQTDILSIIVNGALLFIGAIIATTALMKQGILRGRDSIKYQETLAAHIKQKQKIYPKIKELQPWLDQDYYKLLKVGRTVYVNSAGYDYSELFTEEGKVIAGVKVKKPEPLKFTKWTHKATAWFRRFFNWWFGDEWKIYRQKKKLIRKAKRYKITRQTVSYLLNVDEDKDPNNFGITETQYTKRQGGSAVISRLIFSILLQSVSFGFYGFNLETFLMQLLSIVLVLATALYSMFNSYFFMVKTHRETIIKKINKLEEFDNSKNVKVVNEMPDDKKKEENSNVAVHTEKSLPAESGVVEKVFGRFEHRQENDLSSDAVPRV